MPDFEKAYRLDFPRGRVYDAWVSEGTVIPPASRMEIDPRVGGVYRLLMPGDVAMTGTFSRLEPGRSLAYSWQWSGDDEQTRVEVDFEADAGATRVTVRHLGFESEASFERHARGWDAYLAGLAEHLGTAGGPGFS